MVVYTLSVNDRVDSVWESLVDLCEWVAGEIIASNSEEEIAQFTEEFDGDLVATLLDYPETAEEFGYKIDDVNFERNKRRK